MTQGPVPLWQRIRNALTARIEAGDFPTGTYLPGENALAQSYNASRQTIRRALSELSHAGLLAIHKGKGACVLRSAARPFRYHISSLQDLSEIPQQTRLLFETREEIIADSALAAATGCAEGSSWLRLKGPYLDAENDLLIGYKELWVAPEFAELLPETRALGQPLFHLLQDARGAAFAEIEQTIRPQLLAGRPAGANLALEIRRNYRFADGEVVLMTCTTLPADRAIYSMSFAPSA